MLRVKRRSNKYYIYIIYIILIYIIVYYIILIYYIYNYINHCTFWEAHGPTDTAGHSGHTAGSCFKAVQSPPCRKVSNKDWDEVGYMLHPEVITWWGVFGVDKSSSLWGFLIELNGGVSSSARCTRGYSFWDWGPILDLLSDHRFVAIIGPSTFTVKRNIHNGSSSKPNSI